MKINSCFKSLFKISLFNNNINTTPGCLCVQGLSCICLLVPSVKIFEEVVPMHDSELFGQRTTLKKIIKEELKNNLGCWNNKLCHQKL